MRYVSSQYNLVEGRVRDRSIVELALFALTENTPTNLRAYR